MSNNIAPFLEELPNWKSIVKEKWLLFDTNAIITIIECQATKFMNELKELDVELTTINPVIIELYNSNNLKKRFERQSFIDKFGICEFSLKLQEFNKAKEIQSYLAAMDCYPDPTDLYLAGTLGASGSKDFFLLTGNLSHFPYPLFSRKSGIIFDDPKSRKILSLLTLDKSELAKVKN